MDKDKTILDIIIESIDEKCAELTVEISKEINSNDRISLINRVFPERKSMDVEFASFDDVRDLIAFLYDLEKEKEIVSVVNAAVYLVKNEVELHSLQKLALDGLMQRALMAKKNMLSDAEKKKELIETFNKCQTLSEKLKKLEGVVDSSVIKDVFDVLGCDEQQKSEYLYDLLKFNLKEIRNLGLESVVIEKTSTVDKDKVDSEVSEDNPKQQNEIDLTSLTSLLKKYGYDLCGINDKYKNKLLSEGNLENVESVLDSISKNKIDFLISKKDKGKSLVQFLLYSNGEIIDNICGKIRGKGVKIETLKSYKLVFFPNSEDRRKYNNGRKRVLTTDNNSIEEDTIIVRGAFEDFEKNFHYITTNFVCDEKRLIERGSSILTMPHSKLLEHVEELELYGYKIHDSKFPLSALNAYRLMDSTDSFIELDEEKYIKRYASKLLGNCKDIARRIYTCKVERINYHSDTHYGTLRDFVTMANVSPVSDNLVKKTVPTDVEDMLNNNHYLQLLDSNQPRTISSSTLDDPVISILEEQYKVDESRYEFGDVIISRRKLLRNYEFLVTTPLISDEEKDIHKILLASAISNSILNSNQIEKVDSALVGAIQHKGGQNGVSKK